MPNRDAITLSPGESVLEREASHAPVPLDGKMNACPEVVLKIFFRLSRTGAARAGKSEERWSSMARCMARRTRSGTLVGPGTKRKLRPAMETSWKIADERWQTEGYVGFFPDHNTL